MEEPRLEFYGSITASSVAGFSRSEAGVLNPISCHAHSIGQRQKALLYGEVDLALAHDEEELILLTSLL
jgi:hypothetical protein